MKGKTFIKLGVVFMVASFAVFGFKNADMYLTDFNNDYLLSRIVVNNIENNYEDFNNKVSKYKEDMTTFYGSLDFYFDNFIRKNRAMKTYLAEVEKDLKQLEGSSLRLYENCRYEINDEKTETMCKNFKINLDGVITSYQKLVDDYNQVLDSFNGFAESYNRKNDVVDLYESKLSDKLLKIYTELQSK
jgi:hypothetical protein